MKKATVCDFPDMPVRGTKIPCTVSNVKALLDHYAAVVYVNVCDVGAEDLRGHWSVDGWVQPKQYWKAFPQGYWCGLHSCFTNGTQGLHGIETINQGYKATMTIIRGMAQQQGLHLTGLEDAVRMVANNCLVETHEDMMQKVFNVRVELENAQ